MRPVPRPSWQVNYPRIIPDSIPQVNQAMLKGQPLSAAIQDMQETGFQHWGFVIYRCAYANNAQWESYLEFLKATMQDELEFDGLYTLLWKYLDWTVIEDPDKLDGASKQDIRERFSEWSAGRSVERDGSGVDAPTVEDAPRFHYCIYIDQKCLDTVDEYQSWAEAGGKDRLKVVVCAILDKDCKPKGRGRGGFPSVEGCTREDTGWMYTDVASITSIYNRLSYQELADNDYSRPPAIWPTIDVMPAEP
ncbi:hypothetical protein BGZ61DRAFT_558943 [Ilyonectria robusta]|uniref:uncharacterized protein n=1 Tax=Ilyonectria robusta TaxID=1079257 RepID=UPI001E8EF08E|nr:uncharacterized protein BGZ61DRAFT_558943 [Ilyonectria robusta]KAH8666109.1 hypothetical protein BGZ61DRAFT_558943 [Ilyonectria robusta]